MYVILGIGIIIAVFLFGFLLGRILLSKTA